MKKKQTEAPEIIEERKVAEEIAGLEETLKEPGKMKQLWGDLTNGIFRENPLLVLLIGLCSALAVSTQLENTIFMGAAATFVIISSNVIVSSIKKIIPHQIRIPIFIVVIASFVTIVDLTMKAYFPPVYARLGVWIPLIVVNCMILGRSEAFAYKQPIVRSAVDGLGMGLGYTLVLMTMGLVRELFGSGQLVLFDTTILSLGSSFQPATIMILFPGAFLVFGVLIGLMNIAKERMDKQ